MALAKFLYGALFTVLLPALLVLWAAAAARNLPLPAPFAPPLGWTAAAAGAALLLLGVRALWFHGGGLPMNAFPPPRFVSRGVYRYLAHPIYIGFSMLVAGVALLAQSPAGAWLVAPSVMLGSTALVFGYERQDLAKRFGERLQAPLIHLPPGGDAPPTLSERLSIYALVLGPWLLIYEALRALPIPPDALQAWLPFERHWPVWQWTNAVYASAYLLVPLAPLVARSRGDLRRFALRGLLAMAAGCLLFLTVPLIAPPRPFAPTGPLGVLLAQDRAWDTPAEAFPSFHAIWALLAAEVFAGRTPRLRWLWRAWALAVAASCLTTGMHALVDVAAAFLLVWLSARAGAFWECLRGGAERIANSWREWRWGPLRLINHGLWAGLAAFTALWLPALLMRQWAAPLCACLLALVLAGLWAQYIEGSPHLLRPYGFYGGVLGVVAGALAAPLFSASPWLLLAAFSVAAPWIQSLGRLRCLVQGCCHGALAAKQIGIRYHHPRSRVCRLTEWRGLPLHPTPLYSILWNLLIAAVMARLWSLGAALPLIAGVYLLLGGFGRFVEEAYRGEPQTPVYAGLRLYQWVAVASVAAGALVTALPGPPAPPPQWSAAPLPFACAFGLLTALAMGADFPDSNRRFSRLA